MWSLPCGWWQALQSFWATGACCTGLSASHFLKLVISLPAESFIPSFEWQLTHWSNGSWRRIFSTLEACGLWQFPQAAPSFITSCLTFAFIFLAMAGWHELQSVT